MSRIVPLRTRRIRQAIPLSRDQCERILSAADLLAPPLRPEFIQCIERKLRDRDASISHASLFDVIYHSFFAQLQIETCDD
jgi:hypothetical protein